MADDRNTLERLVSLETKLEFIQALLKEIRDDIKDQPSKEEYIELKNKVAEVEKTMIMIKVKVFTVSAIISLVCSNLGVYFIQLLMRK